MVLNEELAAEKGLMRDTDTGVVWRGSVYATVSDSFDLANRRHGSVVGVFAPSSVAVARTLRSRRRQSAHVTPRPKSELRVVVIDTDNVDKARPTSRFVNTKRSTVTCEIEDVFAGSFTAIYWDGTSPRRVRMASDDLTREERALVKPRTEFHWSVGRESLADGSSSTKSLIVFKRKPTNPPIADAREIAATEARLTRLGISAYDPGDFERLAEKYNGSMDDDD